MKKNKMYLLNYDDAVELELEKWFNSKKDKLPFELLSKKKLKRKNETVFRYEWYSESVNILLRKI